MHEYTVEFRIHGSDLVPSAITEDLGLEPTEVRNVGDRRDLKSRWEDALWAYDGHPDWRQLEFPVGKPIDAGHHPPSQGSKTWNSLEDGLRSVLDKLWPLKDKIDSYKSKFKVMLWCGHFYSAFNGGPTFSPALLKILGEFGVELFIDTYFVHEDQAVSDEDR
jgi:hypothetical protein